jgi:hypothetical protein
MKKKAVDFHRPSLMESRLNNQLAIQLHPIIKGNLYIDIRMPIHARIDSQLNLPILQQLGW